MDLCKSGGDLIEDETDKAFSFYGFDCNFIVCADGL